jgi:hypothetical protein
LVAQLRQKQAAVPAGAVPPGAAVTADSGSSMHQQCTTLLPLRATSQPFSPPQAGQ